MHQTNLGKTAFKATFFIALNTYANIAINFVTGIILRKFFLPAEVFGLDALARFFLDLFGRLREFGFELAAIHRQTEVNKIFSTFFILQTLIGIVNFLLILLFFPVFRHFYPDQPLLPLLVLVYGGFAIIRGFYLVQKTFLEKHLLFKHVALFDVISLFLASLLGVITASLGWGVWSLVVLNSAYLFFNFILVWLKGEWKLQWYFDWEIARWFFKFGFFLWVGAITTFVLYKYNDFVIGSLIGLSALGFYTTALSYAQMPTSFVTSIVSRVALPTYAALQNDKPKLEFTYNFVLKNIVRFSLPISITLFLIADDFILFLLNETWAPVIPIFKFLIIYSLIKPIFEDTGAFLAAIGRPKVVSFYISIQALVLLILSPALIRLYQVEGAALGLGLTMLAGCALAYYYVSRYVRINYWENFGPSFLISLMVLMVFSALDIWLLQPMDLTLWVKLLVDLVIIGFLYLLLYYLIERNSLKVDINYLKELAHKKG